MALDLLTELRIGEVSTVDHPATELDGWMVAKAAKNPTALMGEFRKVFKEIASADMTDDEKIDATRKAIKLAPAAIRDQLTCEAIAAQAVVEKSGGATISRAPKEEPVETMGLLSWRVGGAVHPALRTAT
jgi:hypothetical protein